MLSCERRDVFDRAFETIAGGCRYHGLKTYKGVALPRDSVLADRWYVGSSCQQVGALHQAEVEGHEDLWERLAFGVQIPPPWDRGSSSSRRRRECSALACLDCLIDLTSSAILGDWLPVPGRSRQNPCRDHLVEKLVHIEPGNPRNNHRAVIVIYLAFDGEHLARIGDGHIGKCFMRLP